MRDKERDELRWRETGVLHAGENLVDVVLWLGDKTECGGVRWVGTTGQELEARCTRALRDRDGTGKLDQVTSGDRELLKQWLEVVNRIINAIVGSCRRRILANQ